MALSFHAVLVLPAVARRKTYLTDTGRPERPSKMSQSLVTCVCERHYNKRLDAFWKKGASVGFQHFSKEGSIVPSLHIC